MAPTKTFQAVLTRNQEIPLEGAPRSGGFDAGLIVEQGKTFPDQRSSMKSGPISVSSGSSFSIFSCFYVSTQASYDPMQTRVWVQSQLVFLEMAQQARVRIMRFVFPESFIHIFRNAKTKVFTVFIALSRRICNVHSVDIIQPF